MITPGAQLPLQKVEARKASLGWVMPNPEAIGRFSIGIVRQLYQTLFTFGIASLEKLF